MLFLADPDDWGGSLPVAVVHPAASDAERRALLRRLAARVLELPIDAVEIAHDDGRAPRLLTPTGTPLVLSSASRSGLAALAAAFCAVGVDVEQVEPGGDLPVNVLHRREVEFLLSMPDRDRPKNLARLWSCKEGYLKALGLGLSREPTSFRIAFIDEERSAIHDPEASCSEAVAFTMWRIEGGHLFAISAVLGADSSARGRWTLGRSALGA